MWSSVYQYRKTTRLLNCSNTVTGRMNSYTRVTRASDL